MEFIYTLSSFAITLVVIIGIIGLITPKALKRPLKRHATRKHIFVGGLASLMLLSGVVSATEPQHIKDARIAKEQAAISAQQLKEKEAAAKKKRAVVKTEVKTETKSETIPFSEEQREDAKLTKGQTKVVQEGANGEKKLIYKVTYKNGKETARELVSEEVTQQPISRVVALGTYVAPPPKPKPTTTPAPQTTNPSGATALCRDGTLSYSQNRRGTCSHHGGVSVWY